MRTPSLKHICLGLLFGTLGSPAISVIFNNHRNLSYSELIIVAGGSAFGIILIVATYQHSPRLNLLFTSLLSFLAGIEDWFIWHYGWPIDVNTLNVILETNPAEAFDFLSAISRWQIVAVLGIPCALCLIAWNARGIWRDATSIRLACLALVGFVGIACSGFLDAQGASPTPDETFHPDPTGQFLSLRASYPTGAFLVLSDFISARIDLRREVERAKSFRFGVKPLRREKYKRVYVLVIGESLRADHLGINGYHRQTTPLLSARTGVIPLKRMYTVPTFTRLAVPALLTRKSPKNVSATFKESSIVEAYREAGFNTTWISLQAPVGYHESPVSLNAAEAEKKIFLNPIDYRNRGVLDDAAITEIKKILESTDQRDQFIVVHMLGSHFQYTDRYPKQFVKFLPDRKKTGTTQLFDKNDKEYLVNAYDNSVLFTDFVLNEIIAELSRHDGNSSWLIYSSDHGEALFDDCRNFSGHGLSSLATQSVASLFWASHRYIEDHPSKVETIQAHANSLKSTSMMFETLADLGELNVAQTRMNNSLASNPLRTPDEVRDFERVEHEACDASASPSILSSERAPRKK